MASSAANPFFVQPANPLQALLLGQQSYGKARESALNTELGEMLAKGGDYRAAAAIAAQAGKPELAIQLAKLSDGQAQQRDFQRQFENIHGGGGGAPAPVPAAAPGGPPQQSPLASLMSPNPIAETPQVQPGPEPFRFGNVISAIGPDGVDRAPAMAAVGQPTAQPQPPLAGQPGTVGSVPRERASVPSKADKISKLERILLMPGLSEGQRKVVEGQIKREEGGLEDAQKLRKEFGDVTKNHVEVHRAFQRVIAADKTPAGHISLVFSFMRMLDPTSTVREGEYATARNAAGIPDQIKNIYNKALEGTFLTEDQIANFKGQAQALFGKSKNEYDARTRQFTREGARYGISPESIISDLGEEPTYTKPPEARAAAAPQEPTGPVRVRDKEHRDSLPSGTSYIAPDGSVRTKQ